MWQCKRHHDLQFPANSLQLGQVETPVHYRITARANADQTSKIAGSRLILRHVASGILRCTTAHAIDFARLTLPLVFQSPCLQELDKIQTVDIRRSFVIDGWQTALNPVTHRIPMNVKPFSDRFDRVAAGTGKVWN